jgi:uncharacterized protein YrrD
VGIDEDFGEPISYIALEEGTPVSTADGDAIGKVAHVLADVDDDIFDGIVIEASERRRRYVFADATQVKEIRSKAVILDLDSEQAESLPEPSANPAALEAGPDETVKEGVGEKMQDKLRRAWDRVSGNY